MNYKDGSLILKFMSGKETIMKSNTPTSEKTFACETCPNRKKAEVNPKSLMARLWRWHTGWCPGWKAYQQHLAEQKSAGLAAD